MRFVSSVFAGGCAQRARYAFFYLGSFWDASKMSAVKHAALKVAILWDLRSTVVSRNQA